MSERKYDAPLSVGYSDGSGEECITLRGEIVLRVRWGCGCCQDRGPLEEHERLLRDRVVSTYNLRAGRTREQIEAAFALYDNREKVVENLYAIASICSPDRNRVPSAELAKVNLLKSYHYATAALALLQAEKKGVK